MQKVVIFLLASPKSNFSHSSLPPSAFLPLLLSLPFSPPPPLPDLACSIAGAQSWVAGGIVLYF